MFQPALPPSELSARKGVSCGIPDFRSENGLYAALKEKNEYDLDDPQQMWVALLAMRLRFHAPRTGLTSSTSGRSQMVSGSVVSTPKMYLIAYHAPSVF